MPDTFADDDLRTILSLIYADGWVATTTEILADGASVYLWRPADDEGVSPGQIFEIPRAHLRLVGKALIELSRGQ